MATGDMRHLETLLEQIRRLHHGETVRLSAQEVQEAFDRAGRRSNNPHALADELVIMAGSEYQAVFSGDKFVYEIRIDPNAPVGPIFKRQSFDPNMAPPQAYNGWEHDTVVEDLVTASDHYQYNPRFRNMVDEMGEFLQRYGFNPEELRDAAMCATMKVGAGDKVNMMTEVARLVTRFPELKGK